MTIADRCDGEAGLNTSHPAQVSGDGLVLNIFSKVRLDALLPRCPSAVEGGTQEVGNTGH